MRAFLIAQRPRDRCTLLHTAAEPHTLHGLQPVLSAAGAGAHRPQSRDTHPHTCRHIILAVTRNSVGETGRKLHNLCTYISDRACCVFEPIILPLSLASPRNIEHSTQSRRKTTCTTLHACHAPCEHVVSLPAPTAFPATLTQICALFTPSCTPSKSSLRLPPTSSACTQTAHLLKRARRPNLSPLLAPADHWQTRRKSMYVCVLVCE